MAFLPSVCSLSVRSDNIGKRQILPFLFPGASACIKLKRYEEATAWCDKGLAVSFETWRRIHFLSEKIQFLLPLSAEYFLEYSCIVVKMAQNCAFPWNISHTTESSSHFYCFGVYTVVKFFSYHFDASGVKIANLLIVTVLMLCL